MITTNYMISYFGFNFDRKSTLYVIWSLSLFKKRSFALTPTHGFCNALVVEKSFVIFTLLTYANQASHWLFCMLLQLEQYIQKVQQTLKYGGTETLIGWRCFKGSILDARKIFDIVELFQAKNICHSKAV